MMVPASPTKGLYAARLTGALQPFVDDRDLGAVLTAEPGFALGTEHGEIVWAPDVAFVAREHLPSAAEQAGFWPLAPDLAVEIVSPSDLAAELQAKVKQYLSAGVRLVWVVYPRTQTVLAFSEDGSIRQYDKAETLEAGPVLPGFAYPLARLFRE
ncbi:MAG: Uma2 family endonuclease [Myxococcales bacterium]|jgi:Uma2 family endonuclease